MKTVIKVENLSKKFRLGKLRRDESTLRDLLGNFIKYPFSKNGGNEKPEILWALRDICFEVKQGETFGIIGGNGAGKSTLLKILSKIIKPTLGRATLKGRVGSLLEIGTGFHQDLTGRENIFLNGAILGMRQREVEKKFDEIVAFADIDKFIDTAVKFYSTGMYARLAFAVAAHLEPEILIIDEVLAVGDAAFQAKCLGKMGSIAEGGRTVLFVSHDAFAVKKLCKTGLYLEKGQIKRLGSMTDVMEQYQSDNQFMTASDAVVQRNITKISAGEAQFINWVVMEPKSGDPHTVISRENLTLEFVFVSQCHTQMVNFKFSIKSAGKSILSVTNSTEIKAGTHRIQWSCELPLMAGYYDLYAEANHADQPDIKFDIWQCQPGLTVLSSETFGLTGDPLDLINIPISFNVVCE